VPRRPDGTPDLSGIWNYAGILGFRGRPPDPPPGTPPEATFWNIEAGFKEGLPFQPWAAELRRQRMAVDSRDNPDAHCLPLGHMQLHTHSQPRKIVQTDGVTTCPTEGEGHMNRIALALTMIGMVGQGPARAADPQSPVVWTSGQIAELEQRIRSEVDPVRHLGLERLLDSATLIYRDGPSEAEIHERLADFITVRSGEGYVVVGGEIVDARRTTPEEWRGPSINGGTKYPFAAGDLLYIPANMVHQFFPEPDKDFTVTIVKITPRVDPAAQTGPSPRNDLPQLYRTTRDWGELPAGVSWAAVTAVEPTPDGSSIYVVHRCFENSCAGRPEAPILKYDADGRLLASWGQGLFVFPHGATVDRSGNLWVTDARGDAAGRGHQVFKFSPDGAVLMTLGRAGVAGSEPGLFDQPTDVVVAPNGDIFVSDSHRNGRNNRVVKFTADGTYLAEWGSKGAGPGEMREPHTIAMDSRGRLFVGDRENNRVQIFDQNGTFIAAWRQFGRPSGIFITADDTIYVTDSESGPDTGAGELPGIRKGIRIGSALTGEVTAFIEDSESTATDHSGAEGVGVDADGNVYGAVVRRRTLERHVRE
jgi:DNA-binding beta-propeller fold protein YncE